MTARVLDGALDLAVRRVRKPGGPLVTRRQLYYEVCRVLLPAHLAPARPRFTVPPPVAPAAFEEALHRRAAAVPGLVPPAPPSAHGPPGRNRPWAAAEADVLDYGLPRLLLVGDGDVAAMLRANRWYLDAACPVYTVGELAGLPGAEAVVAAVRTAGGTVSVLHDATRGADGTADAARRLAGPRVRVRPLGLRPAQAAALHLVRLPGGDGCEAAAIPPARLLRGLHRMVTRPSPPASRPWRGWRAAARSGYLSWPAA